MWEERAHRVRRDIVALATIGLGVDELHTAAIALVGREVGADLTCWAAIDPETLVISTMVSGETRIDPEYEPRLAESEYSSDEPNTFAALARRQEPVAKLSELSDHDRSRSARLNNVWRPLGLDSEVRALFLADGACWGAAGMVRAGSDFTDREIDFLAAISPVVAHATRLAVRAEAYGTDPTARPAIVMIGPTGRPRAATPAALEWQQRLDEIAPHRFAVMMQVMAAGARDDPTGEFRARVRDGRGQWAVLRASQLLAEDSDDVAVLIEPTTIDQLMRLLMVAYGLTAREREVCTEVVAGHSTVAIAGRLLITVHTVQDHLKSVFAKVGVRSRGELVARLRPLGPSDHQLTLAERQRPEDNP